MLDTNICIYIVKGKPPTVHEHLAKLPIDRITISSVTLGELRHGVEDWV